MRNKFGYVLCLLLVFIVGCGGPKADISIFMMGPQGIPSEVGDKLKTALETKLGPTPTIALNTSPMFSMEKMIVEIAAGENGIIVLPEDQFRSLAKQGGYISLDDVANPDDFKDGIVEVTDEGKTETHLYGIHLETTKWMKDNGLNGKGLYAFIPANAKNQELAKQVLKSIAEK
ncbi:hypothetical protein D3C73_606330 [compost metagenome]